MKQADPYALISAWYDLEHDSVTDDLECYIGLLGSHSAGRGRVLEVGSGTGRILAALASAGYQVTGVEPSAAMRRRAELRLSQLPERVTRRVHLVAGEAGDLGEAANVKYDAVVYGLNTFAHLTGRPERRRALAAAASHLVGGGLLLLDFDLAGPRRLLHSAGQLYRLGRWRSRESGEWVSHLVSGSPGPEVGTILVTHFYEVSLPGKEVRRTVTPMPLALLSREELELAVRTAGFTVLAVYGGFDLSPYDDLSARAILLARLPGSQGSRPAPGSAYSDETTSPDSPATTGSVKEKVVPSSGVLSSRISPPCCSTMSLAMARPNPYPPLRARWLLSDW